MVTRWDSEARFTTLTTSLALDARKNSQPQPGLVFDTFPTTFMVLCSNVSNFFFLQRGANAPRLHGQRAQRALLPSLPRQDGNPHLRRVQVVSLFLCFNQFESVKDQKIYLVTQNLQASDRGESGDCSWKTLACGALCLRKGGKKTLTVSPIYELWDELVLSKITLFVQWWEKKT